jgi:hypothetical protein
MNMRFGTWKVKGIYRSVLLRVVREEISKYELDFV